MSSLLNSPNNSPLSSVLSRCTVSSNHIFLGFKVDNPFSLNSILFTEYLVTIFPFEALPFISRSAKSNSHFNFLIDPDCLKIIFTISASPLGFAEKYNTLDPSEPLVKSYILSLVTPVTLNLFMKDVPFFPSL